MWWLLLAAAAAVYATETEVVYLNADGRAHEFWQEDAGADRAHWGDHDHPSERCSHTQLHEAAHVFLAPEQRSQPYWIGGWPFPERDTTRVQVSYLLWIDWTAAPPTLELDALRPDVRLVEPRLRYVLNDQHTVEAAAAAPATAVDRVQRLHELHVDGPWVPVWPPVGRALQLGFALENRSPFMLRVLLSCALLTYERPLSLADDSDPDSNSTEWEWTSSSAHGTPPLAAQSSASAPAPSSDDDWAASVWPTPSEESDVFADSDADGGGDLFDRARQAVRDVKDQFSPFELVLVAMTACLLCGVCLATCLFCCAVRHDRRRQRRRARDVASERGLLSDREAHEMEQVVTRAAAAAVYAYQRASQATHSEREHDDPQDVERPHDAVLVDDDDAAAQRRYVYDQPGQPLPPPDSDDDSDSESVLARQPATHRRHPRVYAEHERFRRRTHHHELQEPRRSVLRHDAAPSAPRTPYWYAYHRSEKVVLRGELCEYPLSTVRAELHNPGGTFERLHDTRPGVRSEHVAAVRGYVLRERRRDARAALVLLYDTDVRFTMQRVDEMPLAAWAQERWPAAGYHGLSGAQAKRALATEFHVYCQMARALAFLHVRRVCARALHPDCFVVQSAAPGTAEPRCRLSTLAHCRALPPKEDLLPLDEERDAVLLGGLDAQYAAPELLQPHSGRFVAPASDVWALATCVAALLASRARRGPYAAPPASQDAEFHQDGAPRHHPASAHSVGTDAARARAVQQRDERRRVHALQCRDPERDPLARPMLMTAPAYGTQYRPLHAALHACWHVGATHRSSAAELQERLDAVYAHFVDEVNALAAPVPPPLLVVGGRRQPE